jgi:hypothetical protein
MRSLALRAGTKVEAEKPLKSRQKNKIIKLWKKLITSFLTTKQAATTRDLENLTIIA